MMPAALMPSAMFHFFAIFRLLLSATPYATPYAYYAATDYAVYARLSHAAFSLTLFTLPRLSLMPRR